MEWLSHRLLSDPSLPFDRPDRGPEDYRHIAITLEKLAPDIIALQEVNGANVLTGLFRDGAYQFFMTPTPIAQRVVVAVRQGYDVALNPALMALNVGPKGHHPLREGLDLTMTIGKQHLRILALHLKTGCWEQPLNQRRHACPLLYRQLSIIADWVAVRQSEGVPFVLIGDFNRRFTYQDPAFKLLSRDAKLTLATEGLASPCHGGEYFIDHIILDASGRTEFSSHSLHVMTSAQKFDSGVTSDHCPVSVDIDLNEVQGTSPARNAAR
ncbi:MAG: endonuclease/exonuclease/phosphatase family protein [Acetobacteraceae bacterium]